MKRIFEIEVTNWDISETFLEALLQEYLDKYEEKRVAKVRQIKKEEVGK
jgi:hypothetical protein